MIDRCYTKTNRAYEYYGAIGIEVAPEWLDVTTFINDMYPSFIEGYTLDRKNSAKGYYKGNCRWANASVQSQNTRVLNSKNTSGYRGVYLHKGTNKWECRIRVKGTRIYLGKHRSITQAAIAYNNYVVANNLHHPLNTITNE